MHFTLSSLAVLGLVSSVSGHMIMANPVPYNNGTIDNSPLEANGSNFPCKYDPSVVNTTDVGEVYSWTGSEYNQLSLGGTHELSFIGSATHGGGSCQISITYDMKPTTSSVFKVIHSIEGGCPVKGEAGNIGNSASTVDPDTYSFPVPSDLPTGNAVLAWTWFNKVGNREMYMNCAPVTISGGSSKRSEVEERDTSAYDALPDMFVANVDNGCATVDSTDLLFPNPGDSVEQDGTQTSSALSTPTGTGCQAASGGSGATATAVASSAAVSSAAVSPAVSSPASSAVAATSTTAPGGIFITVPTSAVTSPVAAATSAAVSTVAVSPVNASTVSSAASSGSTGTSGSSGAQTAGAACTDEGEFNCVDGTSYQQCASGFWSVMMPLAAGTSCTPGLSSDLNIQATNSKRTGRFSRAFAHHNAHRRNSFQV